MEKTIKKCSKCKLEKPMSEFHRDRSNKDGHICACKQCENPANLSRYYKNHEKHKEADKIYFQKNKKRIIERQNKNNLQNRIKIQARIMAREAVRIGKLKKFPCEICAETKVQAHHKDYKKPLEVRWLCQKHHSMVHRKYNPLVLANLKSNG